MSTSLDGREEVDLVELVHFDDEFKPLVRRRNSET